MSYLMHHSILTRRKAITSILRPFLKKPTLRGIAFTLRKSDTEILQCIMFSTEHYTATMGTFILD